MDAALKFAQCIRDNGVNDFPDPVQWSAPRRHESNPILRNEPSGMSILNAAMQKCTRCYAARSGGQRR